VISLTFISDIILDFVSSDGHRNVAELQDSTEEGDGRQSRDVNRTACPLASARPQSRLPGSSDCC